MVREQLLMSSAGSPRGRSFVTPGRAAILVALLWGTCFIGRDIEGPEQRGVLVDRRTRKPIAGAEIFRCIRKGDVIRQLLAVGSHGGHWDDAYDWTTTDSQGRFRFEEYDAWENAYWLAWREGIFFAALDPCFGDVGTVFEETLEGGELMLGVEPNPAGRWSPIGAPSRSPAYQRWLAVLDRGPAEECAR